MKKILSFLLAGILFTGNIYSQEAVDSMKIFYRRGYRHVDLSFRDNRAQLTRFLATVEEALKNDRVEKLVIRSYASPDGAAQANEQLAARRAEELKAYLVREGHIPSALIEHHSEGVAWTMLREQVAASDMEARDEVLDIIDHTPLWVYNDRGEIVDSRKKQLMDLRGGRPYRYMLENFFPDLRNSSNTVLYLRIVEKDDAADVDSEEGLEEADSPVSSMQPGIAAEVETTPSRQEAVADTAVKPEPAVQPDDVAPAPTYPRHILGIHAGYASSWITSYGMSSSTKPGYEAGLIYRMGLSRNYPFYLRTGLNFISKGYEINGFDDSSITINYLQFPVGFDYTIALGKHLALIPSAGLYYAVGVWGKRQMGDEKVCLFGQEGGFSRHDMGFLCGVDVAFYRFFVGAEYQQGLIDIDRSDTVYGDDSQMIGYKHVKNRSFVVKVGVYF